MLRLRACIKRFQSSDAGTTDEESISQSQPVLEYDATHRPFRFGNAATSVGRIMLDQFFDVFIAKGTRYNPKVT